MNIKNILFIQDTPPCVRTIKIATVLSEKGVNIHLMYNGKYSANNINEIFTSLNKLKFFNKMKIKQIRSFIDNNNIQLIHYHNEPDNLCANINLNKINPLKIFKWLKKNNITDREMLKTFNCGVGFCLIVKPVNFDKILKYFSRDFKPYVIGRISYGKKKVILNEKINWLK